MVYVVAYDLKTPNDTTVDYQRVMGGIKSNCTTWCHLEKSVFLVESSLDRAVLRDVLKAYVLTGDSLFIARLSGEWASAGIGTERSTWLTNRTF
jgi:hypothetical protein